MIKNNTKSTITLEWMGNTHSIPAGWTFETDAESEKYLLEKYKELNIKNEIKKSIKVNKKGSKK